MLHQHTPAASGDELDLDGHGLTQLDESPLAGHALRKISLYDNLLTAFPTPIFRHRNLRVLNISCNQLDRLPPEIGQLQQLEMFDFGHNRASELPKNWGSCIG